MLGPRTYLIPGIWSLMVVFASGLAGGIFTSVSGSGLDICSFSILTLLFRVTEKTATPTSVLLMAGNTVVGFYWRVVCGTFGQQSWSNWSTYCWMGNIWREVGDETMNEVRSGKSYIKTDQEKAMRQTFGYNLDLRFVVRCLVVFCQKFMEIKSEHIWATG